MRFGRLDPVREPPRRVVETSCPRSETSSRDEFRDPRYDALPPKTTKAPRRVSETSSKAPRRVPRHPWHIRETFCGTAGRKGPRSTRREPAGQGASVGLLSSCFVTMAKGAVSTLSPTLAAFQKTSSRWVSRHLSGRQCDMSIWSRPYGHAGHAVLRLVSGWSGLGPSHWGVTSHGMCRGTRDHVGGARDAGAERHLKVP
jgi:hypothetical protein